MTNKYISGLVIAILTLAVLVGAYLTYSRYFIEVQNKTVELCVDLNDLKKMAAQDKRPLLSLLQEIKELGFTSIGVFEQTLSEASAQGDLFYMTGSGVLTTTLKNTPFDILKDKGLIKPSRTYISAPDDTIRLRVYNHLESTLGKGKLQFLGKDIFEVDETAEELSALGLGISENDHNFFSNLGFSIIPRVWNDGRYDIEKKILYLSPYATIIFDGEEVLGYPDKLAQTAAAMAKYKVNYGHVEIITQYGNDQLKKLTADNIIRVHSASQKELRKLTPKIMVERYARGVRERGVKLLYVRPFLSENTPESNFEYFNNIKTALEKSGFFIGKAEKIPNFQATPWQIKILGLGVIAGSILLLNNFINLSPIVILFLFGLASLFLPSPKVLALLAALVFPAQAVISNFVKKSKIIFSYVDVIMLILNILGETMIGVFLIVGLLANYRFMVGAEVFVGVKAALVLPMAIIAWYFIPKDFELFGQKVSLGQILATLVGLALIGILLARSGNFIIPVSGLEQSFRRFLETVMVIRPRTKEFLIGYPFLFMAALAYFRGKTKWLWLLVAVGAIAPISALNSFTHIHTPIMISMIRTINGLVLGIIIGLLAGFLADKFFFQHKT